MTETQKLFKNGQIASEKSPTLRQADVLVNEKGSISAVESYIETKPEMDVIDCSRKILVPGLFDMHVHLREPGREDKETIETGTEAAINGGVTGLLAMPNTTPPIDSGGMVRFVLTLAKERARIPVMTSGCITHNRQGKELAEIADMKEKGVVMITDDGSPVANSYLFRRALEYARNFDLIVASHCETMELSADGAMHEGKVSYQLGIPGIPACSEEISIERDLSLAHYTKARIHIQHVSTARGMEIIRRFKEEGVHVTAEVTPHHLLFSEEDIGDYNTAFKMNPPLRTKVDNQQLLEGLKEGIFDIIATDHAPHTTFEKNLDFSSAPFGITGLETALLSLYTYLVKPGKTNWNLFVKTYSAEPRRILGLPSVEIKPTHPAEFIVFDPDVTTIINKAFMRSKSVNTPFLGKELMGRVEKVIYKNEILLDRLQK
ncbi:MAG: amidohydrolase family protein [Kiritimatiellae bacterium]|nr:amidohydrolase family protein [Kiritimatiellia bacterium]